MNIGIYVDSLSDTKQLKHIGSFINSSISSLEDASVFYNDIGYVPFEIKCGFFNSTDIWNFDGVLVTTSLNCLLNVLSIVNDIKIYYYYGWSDNNDILNLINIVSNNDISTICTNIDSSKEFYRVTGKKPIAVCEDYSNLLEILKEHDHGFSENRKNVCRR